MRERDIKGMALKLSFRVVFRLTDKVPLTKQIFVEYDQRSDTRGEPNVEPLR